MSRKESCKFTVIGCIYNQKKIEVASELVDSFAAKILTVIATTIWPDYSDLADLPKSSRPLLALFSSRV